MNKIHDFLCTHTTEEIILSGQENAVKLFHYAAEKVPAYSDFLKRNSITAEKIVSYQDLLSVPPVHKQNYLLYYEPYELVPEGKLSRQEIISVSSGSSGKPFYWPRQQKEDIQAADFFDLTLHHSFNIGEESVLCIIGFAMGSWIAGPHCLEAMRELNRGGKNITCITPGNKKDEIIEILKTLSPLFDKTVILAYPPFAKDLVDHALEDNIDLLSLNLSYIFAGENFSEEWRDYITIRSGITDPAENMFGIYGTADAGIIAHETPFSIYSRREALVNADLFELIYQQDVFAPSLVSYYPPTRDIHQEEGQLILTVDSGIPLVRYKIGDRGEIIMPSDIEDRSKDLSFKKKENFLWSNKMPLVTLRGRTDLAAIFYSANIFPENIKLGIDSKKISFLVTGKFIVSVNISNQDMSQSLKIKVQLKKGVEAGKENSQIIRDEIIHALRKSNSEYNDVCIAIGAQADPIIELSSHDDPEFLPGIKHRWLAKS
jgi:phenylacetate-CoA ligase